MGYKIKIRPEDVTREYIENATPDALWNNTHWEYKSITSVKSIDNRIKHAWHQLRENAERKKTENEKVGLVIDASKSKARYGNNHQCY